MSDPLVTFVTTTSYGSWLPGDARGFVQNGTVLPANPELERHAKRLLRDRVVLFSPADCELMGTAFLAACREFFYWPLELAVEPWHAHWIVRHVDPVATMVGRLKSRMRQSLGRGRVWTAGYCHRVLESDDALAKARAYVRRHTGWRAVGDRRQESPGEAGG